MHNQISDNTVDHVMSPEFISEGTNPQDDGIWRWSLQEIIRFRSHHEVLLLSLCYVKKKVRWRLFASQKRALIRNQVG